MKVSINNMQYTAVGGAQLKVIEGPNGVGQQLVVFTDQPGQGVVATMDDVLFADFTLLPAEEELVPGLTVKFTRGDIKLETTHTRVNGHHELSLDFGKLNSEGVQEVLLESFAGLTPSEPGPIPLRTADSVNGAYRAAAAEDPPDTIYYYQNEDGSWGYGYDWNKDAAVTLFPQQGNEITAPADLLRVALPPSSAPKGSQVTFEIIRREQPQADAYAPSSFRLAQNKLIPTRTSGWPKGFAAS